MARKFLYIVATLIVLVILAAFAYRIWGQQLISAAMVPSADFVEQKPFSESDYARADMWYARPDITKDNPALWKPKGFTDPVEASATSLQLAAIFYIHPTSYINRAAWNGPLEDADAQTLARQYVRGQASAFNAVGTIWAPTYRQATFGVFLTEKPEAQKALNAAYADVVQAFTVFLKQNPNGPIVLAAHSQGTVHLLRLIREKVADKPLKQRIAAAYAVGWPISVTADLPALGMRACETAQDTGCILSWQSFAEPADPAAITAIYDAASGFTGKPRKGTHMLCTNPLTGVPDTSAPIQNNLGTLQPEDDSGMSKLVAGAVPARCNTQGYLLIGSPPELGPFVLPGNNYHVYDYGLFWANIRQDVHERVKQFRAR